MMPRVLLALAEPWLAPLLAENEEPTLILPDFWLDNVTAKVTANNIAILNLPQFCKYL